ncbi:hypothetical protein RN51_00616 [Microbacterium oxydans]|uniref:Uncharacterized protein n=1 Tax=Microbacterium oxydans TaxID=82380 RepID=A0A0F0KYB6_9MICO|nr:membrane protein [Microbacterium oxydans]KJL25479.1 hypothetical protein RN51_00616 [Microbacterium oxydans]
MTGVSLSAATFDTPPVPGRWSQLRRSRRLRPYNRLALATVLLNLVAWAANPSPTAEQAFVVAGVNVFVAAIVRQQYVINALFRLATSIRSTAPLRVRWGLGKIYSFGGVHVGAAVSATAWYVAFCVLAISDGPSPLFAITAVLGSSVLIAMLVTALPPLRARWHDAFEVTHRLGGWLLLVLVWVQTVATLVDARASLLHVLSSAGLWLLLATTVSVALPWMRLRRVPVDVSTPSSHVAIARFDYGVTPFAGSSTSISRNPLLEWHSFANVPTPGEPGFRLTISRAGDWTSRFIDDKPRHVWVKGIPTAGVGNIDKLFRKVVWVATGSGIGPCLPHLLAGTAPAHLVWSARAPRNTYGIELVAEIRRAVPDALVWDTASDGKPDLLALARHAVATTGAEAVICISNSTTTWSIVEGLEQQGIPAFGAIWDS